MSAVTNRKDLNELSMMFTFAIGRMKVKVNYQFN